MGGVISKLITQRVLRTAALALLATCLLPTSPLFAADDDYLKALREEAMGGTPAEEKKAAPATTAPTSSTGIQTAIPKGLSQPQMEEWLMANYFGSYMFYNKLSDSNKQEVYSTYTSGGTISEVRDKIQALLK